MAALQYVHVPGYSAIIFRKTLTDLQQNEGLLHRAHEWLDPYPEVRYIPSQHTFEWPNGARIAFGYLGSITAWMGYQGAAYQFCLEVNELILMADGSYLPVGQVRVGDVVSTLEGPKKVTYVSPRRNKECVTATCDGRSQIQSVDHKILTSTGWVSYIDTIYNSAIESYESCNISSKCSNTSSISQQPFELSSEGRLLASEPSLQSLQGTHHQDFSAYRANDQSDYEECCGLPSEVWQPPKLSVLAVRIEPASLSKVSSQSNADRLDEICDDRSSLSLQDCLDHYSFYSDLYGERSLGRSGIFPEHLPLPIGVALPSQLCLSSDARERTHSRNQTLSLKYAHPYTKVEHSSSVAYEFLPCEFTPVGVREVIDIRVEGASHYISSSNLVQSNCGFDELTQHAELYYREMISRVRRVGCHLHGLRIVDGKYAPLPDDPNCYQCLMKGQLSRVPLRVRSASNPGGPGHIWVKKRFKIHKDKTSGMWVSGVGEKPFIPASYLDNPALDSESYKKSLAELDEARRAQLEEGDWDKLATGLYKHNWFRNYIYEGGYFVLLNPETGARETSFHEDRLQKFCIVDIACSVRTGVAGESFYKNTRGPSWTVLGTFGITPNDRLLVLNVRRYQEEAPNLFPAMGDMIKRWKPLFVGMDANGPGRPLFQLARERGFPVKEVMPRGSERVHFDKIANSAEMQNHCKSGRVYLPQIDFTSGDGEQPWVDDLLGELTTWTGHPWDTDDQVDVLSNAGHEFTIMAGNQYRDITIESHMNEIPALQRYTADTLFHGDIFANEGFGYEPPPLPYS